MDLMDRPAKFKAPIFPYTLTKTLPWNRTVFFQIRILFEFLMPVFKLNARQAAAQLKIQEHPSRPFLEQATFGVRLGLPMPPLAFPPSIIILHGYDARATQHHPSLIQGTTWQYPRPPIALLAFNSTLSELHIGHQGTTPPSPSFT